MKIEEIYGYYRVVGVASSASVKEIEKSYKKQALIWHPDKWNETKKYPPYNTTQTKEEVTEHFKILLNACYIRILKKIF